MRNSNKMILPTSTIICLFILILFCFQSFILAKGTSNKNYEELYLKFREEFSDVVQISTKDLSYQLNNMDKNTLLLLDSRSKEEYQVSHLFSAINIESIKESKDFFKDIDKAQLIVIYCSVGYRSSVMAQELQKKGYTNVQNLEGSIFKWVNEGRKVFKNTQAVHAVHPYNKHWGQFLDKQYHSKK